MRIFNSVAAATTIATAFIAFATSVQAQTDAAIRQKIVRASIDSYSGSCPCPYNTDRAGRSCGRRSAYSRPGVYSPKCYASDLTGAEVKAYRASR